MTSLSGIVANVIDFGAKAEGDLGTHDDTQAIQDAIDYVAGNGGGCVYFPKP